MALPDRLHDEFLYLFVLGPGSAETVLLRVPPDQWLIIDSFLCARQPVAEHIVTRYGGEVASIVLTHPHQDHHPGFLEMIDRYPNAVLRCVHPRDSIWGDPLTPDPVAALKQRVKPTYVRIWDEWERDGSRRWATFRSESVRIADATVTSLHPQEPVDAELWSEDLNEVSSAMLVQWHGLRLLLGADVPNSQWPDIAADFPGLGDHAAMKVPHHGSRKAISDVFGTGPGSRCWIVTPFARKDLPRAADVSAAPPHEQEGMSRILNFVSEFHLTSLPFKHDCQHMDPCETTRQAIRDDRRPRKQGRIDPGLTAMTAALDRHVMVAFDRSGTILAVLLGVGAVRVGNEVEG